MDLVILFGSFARPLAVVLFIACGYVFAIGNVWLSLILGLAGLCLSFFSITTASTQPCTPEIEVRQPINYNDPETCVLCKAETPYKKNTHIDHRQHYIEGSGQLCEKCFKETYGEES
ncbi:MAG: hypothetical protein G01um10143_653 [Parcubacteria group bacterium Gr01-1014_3]|nr:MAG: hypothetical protein G01um10143_653 [Parcubacteria group bacterium Gr01-1014_3]